MHCNDAITQFYGQENRPDLTRKMTNKSITTKTNINMYKYKFKHEARDIVKHKNKTRYFDIFVSYKHFPFCAFT